MCPVFVVTTSWVLPKLSFILCPHILMMVYSSPQAVPAGKPNTGRGHRGRFDTSGILFSGDGFLSNGDSLGYNVIVLT